VHEFINIYEKSVLCATIKFQAGHRSPWLLEKLRCSNNFHNLPYTNRLEQTYLIADYKFACLQPGRGFKSRIRQQTSLVQAYFNKDLKIFSPWLRIRFSNDEPHPKLHWPVPTHKKFACGGLHLHIALSLAGRPNTMSNMSMKRFLGVEDLSKAVPMKKGKARLPPAMSHKKTNHGGTKVPNDNAYWRTQSDKSAACDRRNERICFLVRRRKRPWAHCSLPLV
jgi:hypothetical protein